MGSRPSAIRSSRFFFFLSSKLIQSEGIVSIMLSASYAAEIRPNDRAFRAVRWRDMYPSGFTRLIPLPSPVAVVAVLWAVSRHSQFYSVFPGRSDAEEYRRSKIRSRTSDYRRWTTHRASARATVFGRAWIPTVSRTCRPEARYWSGPSVVCPGRSHPRWHRTPSRTSLPHTCPRSGNGAVTRCYSESPKSRSASAGRR